MRQRCTLSKSCVSVSVFLRESVSDLSLVELDQSWPGSVAAVVQDQVSEDGQTLLV